MKKTILIIVSVVLNISFILLFVFLQIDNSEKEADKELAIKEIKKELGAQNNNQDSYSKTEFYDNDQIKYKRISDNSGFVKEMYFFYDGTIHKEKTSINSNPYEEVIYHKNGNRKQYLVYEQDNIVNITTNYPNGSKESEGRKISFNGKNDIFHGRWIWYNKDGTIREEKNFD